MRLKMKKLKLLTLFFSILAFSACDTVDFGNINQDDDSPQEANVEGMMAGAMNQFFTLAGRSYHLNPTLYVQYQTQSVYTTEARYGQNSYPWSGYFSGVLSNFNEIYQITTAATVPAEVTAFGAADNQAAVAELMSVMVWKRVADTWGPIPYSNALQGIDNTTPAYTAQETIYQNLITRAQDARDMINTAAAGPTGDVVYAGNMANWQKFANSLLMDLSLQLSKQYPNAGAYAANQFNEALGNAAGYIDEVSEEFWYEHQNIVGANNPFSRNRGADYFLSEPYTDAMMGSTNGDSSIVYSNTTYDERLNVLSSSPGTSGGAYGVNDAVSGASISFFSNPAAPLHYMTAADTYLDRAEAAELDWTGETVATMLQQGIVASYASIDAYYDDDDPATGDLTTDGSAFASQRVLDADSTSNLQVIGEEKWAALFPMGFQAWSEWRRTTDRTSWGANSAGLVASGYPGLYPSPDATNGGTIPRRYIYPSNEGGVNTDSYEAGVQLLSPASDQNTSRFWWDQ